VTTFVNFLVGFAVFVAVVFFGGSMIESLEKCDYDQKKRTWYTAMGTVLWVVVILVVGGFLCWGFIEICIELGRYIILQIDALQSMHHFVRTP